MENKKIDFLVVDTSAFLNNVSIQDLGENVITCKDVVNEVTSSRQIRRLVVLPYDLQIKDVFPENVKFVTDFSKKTGDYLSLSATDIKVIALTYQLEKEIVGASHLREAPEIQRTISFQNRPAVDLKDTVGFYIPSKERKDTIDCPEHPSDCVEDVSKDLSSRLSLKCSNTGKISVEDQTEVENNESDDKDSDLSSPGDVDPSTVLIETSCAQSSFSEGEENLSENDEDCTEDEDDEEEGWITPSNIKEMKRKINADFEEEKHVQVACLTTDFAMQNVLKQIGLHVSSVEGKIIKQMRTYILRCYACFKTTSIMTKVFCPHCGHKTLKRVSVSIEPDGSQKIHINAKKRITTKGKRVSLPMFQGGKHSNNPVLYADQPMPHQRPSRIARTKTNILDGDYIPGFSPFALRDTTSKSAMLGIRAREVKHWMRNEPRGHRKK